MNERNKIKFNWQTSLKAIALAVGIFGISETPAQSMPETVENSWQVAQVSGRSRVTPANSPTPLNVTPGFHIPLPTNSRSSDYYRHSGYRGRYQGSGHVHHHHHHHHHHGRRRHGRQGPVIIINPASSSDSGYSSQNDYIRVIRRVGTK